MQCDVAVVPHCLNDADFQLLGMSRYRNVRAVELKHESGVEHRVVLDSHRFGDRVEIGFIGRVVTVFSGAGDAPGRSRRG